MRVYGPNVISTTLLLIFCCSVVEPRGATGKAKLTPRVNAPSPRPRSRLRGDPVPLDAAPLLRPRRDPLVFKKSTPEENKSRLINYLTSEESLDDKLVIIKELPLLVKDDASVMIVILPHVENVVRHLPLKLRADEAFMIQAAKYNDDVLAFAAPNLCKSVKLLQAVLNATRSNKRILGNVDPSVIYQNPKLVLNVIEKNCAEFLSLVRLEFKCSNDSTLFYRLDDTSPKFSRVHPDVFLECAFKMASCRPELLKSLPRSFKLSPLYDKIARSLVYRDGNYLQYLSTKAREDPQIVSLAMSHDVRFLKSATSEYQAKYQEREVPTWQVTYSRLLKDERVPEVADVSRVNALAIVKEADASQVPVADVSRVEALAIVKEADASQVPVADVSRVEALAIVKEADASQVPCEDEEAADEVDEPQVYYEDEGAVDVTWFKNPDEVYNAAEFSAYYEDEEAADEVAEPPVNEDEEAADEVAEPSVNEDEEAADEVAEPSVNEDEEAADEVAEPPVNEDEEAADEVAEPSAYYEDGRVVNEAAESQDTYEGTQGVQALLTKHQKEAVRIREAYQERLGQKRREAAQKARLAHLESFYPDPLDQPRGSQSSGQPLSRESSSRRVDYVNSTSFSSTERYGYEDLTPKENSYKRPYDFDQRPQGSSEVQNTSKRLRQARGPVPFDYQSRTHESVLRPDPSSYPSRGRASQNQEARLLLKLMQQVKDQMVGVRDRVKFGILYARWEEYKSQYDALFSSRKRPY